MKKILILVVLVLAFFTIDHPMIKEPRDKLMNQFVSDISEAGKIQKDVRAKNVLAKVREQVHLSGAQRQHIEAQLANTSAMQAWQKKYCHDNEFNDFFYGDELQKICTIISEH